MEIIKTQRETPDFVIDKLISKAYLTDNISLLEPSCGSGKIIDRIFTNYEFKGINTTMVELNKQKFSDSINTVLKFSNTFIKTESGFIINGNNSFEVYDADFLRWSYENHTHKFDRIIACPPFKNNIDIDHIMTMYHLLGKKGIMVSLTKPLWIYDNSSFSIAFRKWLEDKDYQFEMLPDNTFIEKYSNVPTAILTIVKK